MSREHSDEARSLFARIVGALTPSLRVAGPPTSSNGASSMHLVWAAPPRPVREVSVVLEIPTPPQVDRLYFWALQAGFRNHRGSTSGAGHIGLQWHPSYPYSTAVNWGGYASGGGELSGSPLSVPSALTNANTGDYRWIPGRRYRLSIGPWRPGRAGDGSTHLDGQQVASRGSWPGTVTDLSSGDQLEIRRLFADGPELSDISMWSEVFADCDHPSVTARWSEPTWVFDDGSLGWPGSVAVNYQARSDGGCDNTDCSTDLRGLTQTTNARRLTPIGTHLAVPESGL